MKKIDVILGFVSGVAVTSLGFCLISLQKKSNIEVKRYKNGTLVMRKPVSNPRKVIAYGDMK